MITKEEFFKRLNERYPDKEALGSLARAGERVMQGAEKLRGKTINLSLSQDMTLDSIVAYVTEIERELSRLGILTCAGPGSFFPPYGLYPDVKNYIGWKKHIGTQLAREEYFYDLIARTGYDPSGRKINVCDTKETQETAHTIEKILTVCDANLVSSLEEADTAVYWGMRFCDSPGPLYASIIPRLQKDENIAALIFYNATSPIQIEFCSDEPDLKVLRNLVEERENIYFIPTGDYINGRMFTT